MVYFNNRVDERRVKILNSKTVGLGPIVYWMSRDQRINDNWALLYAQELARDNKQPLAVVFTLAPEFLGATRRQYGFILQGLWELTEQLKRRQISFFLLLGEPAEKIVDFVKQERVGALITDFDPLRIKRKWREKVGKGISVALVEVDAHNIVPCFLASPKREFGAYTLRPKINKLLPQFLTEFPKLRKQSQKWPGKRLEIDWSKISEVLQVDEAVKEVGWLKSGERAAQRALKKWLTRGLDNYDKFRNDPNAEGQSNLSPYLHFGQLAAQRVALEVGRSQARSEAKEAFLEELIIRRELADNFCYYNHNYDLFEGFPAWAKASLNKHRQDKRAYIYTRQKLERAETHDGLWNAAQSQMVKIGKMHGYMRMYWAKKILEWTKTPEEALKIAIYLNDKYELDGRDPNGYAGIAWSIGGVHDRAWSTRGVFGQVRYMNYNGCKSKFDVKGYIDKIDKTKQN